MDNFTLDRIAEWLHDVPDDAVKTAIRLAEAKKKIEQAKGSHADDIVAYESDMTDEYKKGNAEDLAISEKKDRIEESEDDSDSEDYFYDPV